MKYLLDTCTVSYFLKGNASVTNHIQASRPLDLVISTITILEIEYGFKLKNTNNLHEYSFGFKETKENTNKNNLYQKWQSFLSVINVLPFCDKTALISANIKALLKQKGQMIGILDILIGATALKHNIVCVTSNISEFQRIENLPILNWLE